MDIRAKALVWAALILAAAWIARASSLSDGVSFGIVAVLTVVATTAIYWRRDCTGKQCK